MTIFYTFFLFKPHGTENDVMILLNILSCLPFPQGYQEIYIYAGDYDGVSHHTV